MICCRRRRSGGRHRRSRRDERFAVSASVTGSPGTTASLAAGISKDKKLACDGMVFLGESADMLRLLSMGLVVAGIVGLQLSHT